MPTEQIFLLGAGGHGKVVLDALYACGNSPRLYDADRQKVGAMLLQSVIQALPADCSDLPTCGHVSIGDNGTRRCVAEKLCAVGARLIPVLHPSAVVSASASVGEGCFIAATAVLAAEVIVSEGCIVNHGAVIDHDCRLGRYCHIAPNATLGGEVVLGDEVLIGSGAVVMPGIRIGYGAKIGSGAVVTRDVASGKTVVGIPARVRL